MLVAVIVVDVVLAELVQRPVAVRLLQLLLIVIHLRGIHVFSHLTLL